MNSRYAVALTLIGWYLMMPPRNCEQKYHGCIEANANMLINIEAPLAKWHVAAPFEKLDDCQSELRRKTEKTRAATDTQAFISATNAQCIATDDPRLAK